MPFVGTIKTLRSEVGTDFSVDYEYGAPDELKCVLLGSYTNETHDLIEAAKKSFKSDRTDHYWRVPVYVLREIIMGHKHTSISGNIQIGWVTQDHVFSHVGMVVGVPGTDPPQYTSKYRNIDFSDIGQWLGECVIAIPALDLDLPDFFLNP